jgi:hypothetical protein
VRDPVPTGTATGESPGTGTATGDRSCPGSTVTMFISNKIDEQPSP